MQEVVAVDIGNSAIKIAVDPRSPIVRIDASLNVAQQSRLLHEAAETIELPRKYWLVCSVDKVRTSWLHEWVNEHRPDDTFHVISPDDLDIRSSVEDREALGRDRLLASWFASVTAGSGANSIVIDAGTAVTIDVNIANEGHAGGLIFPGASTCLSSLSANTDALPDLTQEPSPDLSTDVGLGQSTVAAILLGVYQQQLFSIVSIVRSLEEQYDSAVVHACGGGFEPVQHLLPGHWNHDRDMLTKAIFHLKRYL
jgi:pantothenate kinase type III